ncbi:dihydrofolate reductase [Iamia sp. SCSIO 61187]|nr:dihydrofolate reductase [Iamia sp. SCSIO 61187]
MQGFGSPDEDRDGGFEHGGWGAPYRDPSPPSASTFATTSAYLFGRGTYDKMIQFWPHQGDENPMAAHLRSAPKHVVTSSPIDDTWTNAHVLGGDDVEQAVRRLKDETDGDVVVLGSWTLLESLIAWDLVDEYRLFLHPLVLGTGKRLFRPLAQPRPMTLVEATPTPTGVVVLRYRAGGDPGGAPASSHPRS